MNKVFLLLCTLSVVLACIPPNGPELVTKGNKHLVCVTINGSRRNVFNPVVDEFTRVNYTNSYTDKETLYVDDDHTYISVSTATSLKNVKSVSKLYLYGRKYYPILTAVISVEKGEVVAITWDDGCYSCQEGCEQNSMYLEDGEIQIIQANDPKYSVWAGQSCYLDQSCDATKKNCDLKLYIVWSGTDKDGRPLSSSNMRFSRFDGATLSSIYNTIVN
ncbi:hypothetical protein WA158_000354 [Blastocystis sp. Blastoise]